MRSRLGRSELIPETLAPRYALRLDHLRSWHVLRVTCIQCRRTALLYPDLLGRRWPGYTRIVSLATRLRCRRCQSQAASWQVCRLPRD